MIFGELIKAYYQYTYLRFNMALRLPEISQSRYRTNHWEFRNVFFFMQAQIKKQEEELKIANIMTEK